MFCYRTDLYFYLESDNTVYIFSSHTTACYYPLNILFIILIKFYYLQTRKLIGKLHVEFYYLTAMDPHLIFISSHISKIVKRMTDGLE